MTMETLNELAGIADRVKRRAMFVALLSREAVKLCGKPVVVVGGEAVELYSQGGYTTGDIDILAPLEETASILSEWGFEKTGRVWVNKELDLYVDWQGGSLENSLPPETVTIGGGFEVKVIAVEDLVLDRLNAAKYWGDADGIMWAEVLLRVKDATGGANIEYLRKKADAQGIGELLDKVLPSPGKGDDS